MFNFNNYVYLGDLFIFLPDFYWVITVLILLCVGLNYVYNVKSLELSKVLIDLSIPILIISLLLIFEFKDIYYISYFGFIIDSFYVIFRILFLFCLLLIILCSRNYFFLEKVYLFEYIILMLLSVQGSLLLLFTNNLFIFYLAIEIQNLCFYILAALKRYNNFSTEAGLKYFLLGAFSSSLLLFGISLLYGLLGTLNLNEIFFLLNFLNFEYYSMYLFISWFFIISGIIFKLGGAPFHWWVPDVYEGAPTVVTMAFSILPKIVYVFILVKFSIYLFNFEIQFFNVLFLLTGILSLIFGSFNAMYQLKIKRFLAYSAIANIGFLLLAFSISSIEGLFSALFFIFCYIFSVIIIFFFIINYRKSKYNEMITLVQLANITNYNIIVAMIISVVFFSFAGIPPLIGFYGKFFIFNAMMNNYNYFILLISLLFSVLTAFYYIRIIRFLFFSNNNQYSIYFVFNINYLILSVIVLNIFFFIIFDVIGEYLFFILINAIF